MALNPMWTAIESPSRLVAAAHTPSTIAKTKRPGYSIGRKWMRVNRTAVAVTAIACSHVR